MLVDSGQLTVTTTQEDPVLGVEGRSITVEVFTGGVGPQGPAGPAGADGEPGPEGPQGPPGEDGAGIISSVIAPLEVDVDGVLSLDTSGLGAVDSVNGQTGVVVLDAADVGADASGAAAAAQAAAEATAAGALATHAADTTSVHGIADTSALVLTGDSRLSDSRTPTAHATSHQDGGSDELALDGSQITSGTVADARIASTIARDSEVTAAVASEATARDTAIALAIANLIASAPGVLDTLDEIAAALGDDPNFAATITTALAGKQPLDAELTALAGLTSAANKLPYFSAASTASLADFTAFARTLLDDADATAARLTLGLVLGTDIYSKSAVDSGFQPLDSDLTSIAALSTTSIGRSLLAAADAAALRTILSVDASGTAVLKALYDANTILAATTDDTPVALTVAASRVVGRKASGDIAAMTAAETKTVLAIVAADVSDFSEAVDDRVGALVTDGSGIDAVYDDSGNLLTLQNGALTINAQTGTSYTLVLADGPKFVTMSNASASTLTVPPNSSVAFPVGTVIEGAQLGAGQVTLTPGAGVTINATPGLKIAAQYGSFALVKTATDTWLAMGRLSA